MLHYPYHSQDSTTYQSTDYQPVNTSPVPHATPKGVGNESFISPKYGVVTINGRSRPLGFRSIRWWLMEILASVMSVAPFIGIVIVVTHYQGRGLEDINLPSPLNLNGLVAPLSTVCRVALMIPVASVISQEVWTWFYGPKRDSTNRRQLRDLELSDEASRSAWGSFKFLLQGRRNWLAYVASLLTLITLVFGTFTQQLLIIRPFPVSNPTLMPGSVPRSERWSQYFGRASEGPLQPPLSWKAATYNGALTASVTPLIASCPTGNCTWPVTPSLAVCGGCVNSTWQLNCGVNQGAICQYTLPSGETANLTNMSDGDGIGFSVFPSVGSVYNSRRTDILYIANFEAVGAPNDSTSISWVEADNSSTVASECALWMCIQAYETKQVNAAQIQTVVNEYYTVDSTPTADAGVNTTFEFDSNTTFVNIPSDLNTMSSSDYSVYTPATMAMSVYFTSLFNGSLFLDQWEQLPSNDIVAAIWNSSADLDSWIKALAAGLSDVVRTSEFPTPAEAKFYQGTGSQLGYGVRWPWNTLPAVSVGLSLFVLFVIMFHTARSPLRAWKGSPLTLLFTDVDPELRRQAAGAMDTVEGIEKVAGKTSVRLEDRGNGNWSIRTA